MRTNRGGTVHHGGHIYVATNAMITCFLARTREVLANGETQLVPLLHSDGIDLLLIGPSTPFTVTDIGVGSEPTPTPQ